MSAKLEVKATINGKLVEKIDEFGDVVIYQSTDSGDDAELFICNKQGSVLRRMEITASCSQNMGYVDDITFSKV